MGELQTIKDYLNEFHKRFKQLLLIYFITSLSILAFLGLRRFIPMIILILAGIVFTTLIFEYVIDLNKLNYVEG